MVRQPSGDNIEHVCRCTASDVRKQVGTHAKEVRAGNCPISVSIYKSMGGVNQLDAVIAFYSIHKIFFHFVDMVIVVSWLLYRRDCDSLGVPVKQRMDLLKFKFYIAPCLLKQGKGITVKQRGIASSSSVEDKLECIKKRANQTRASRWHPYGQYR